VDTYYIVLVPFYNKLDIGLCIYGGPYVRVWVGEGVVNYLMWVGVGLLYL